MGWMVGQTPQDVLDVGKRIDPVTLTTDSRPFLLSKSRMIVIIAANWPMGCPPWDARTGTTQRMANP